MPVLSRAKLRAAALTDPGCVRTNNEDAYALLAEQGLFVVCDGMGGGAAGEVASRMAVDAIVEHLGDAPEDATSAGGPEGVGYRPKTRRLAQAIQLSNERLYAEARLNPQHTGMGTTVVAAWIDGDTVCVAHVGDSRAYLWRPGRLEAITSDHSVVEAQVQAGLIAREESLQSRNQNLLLRALGPEPAVEADLNEVPLSPGDYLLLCSDGLTTMVPEPLILQIVERGGSPQHICDALIAEARSHGGADNITVVVVEVVRSPWDRVLGLLR